MPNSAPLSRKPIVGVIGGNYADLATAAAARAAGADVAQCGALLLTGGQVLFDPAALQAVKNVAIAGYAKAAGVIGILPGSPIAWDQTTFPGSLFLTSGLTACERDPINALTPDIIVAFTGREGTLCELAYAIAARKPILLHGSMALHAGNFSQCRAALSNALAHASAKFPVIDRKAISAQSLLSFLEEFLRAEPERPTYSPSGLQAALQNLPKPLGPTGFPGLPGDPNSKLRFEDIVCNISQPG